MLYIKLLLKRLSRKEVKIESVEVDKILNDIKSKVVDEITDLYSFFIPNYLFPEDFMPNVKRKLVDLLGEASPARDLIVTAERIIYNDIVELMIKLNHGVMPELAQV